MSQTNNFKEGKFITIEGIEGAGKTTAVQFIRDWLDHHHIDYVTTREPGGTKLAEEIRHILLHHNGEELTDLAELLLFFAGRSQNIEHMILPAIKNGKWVICDRFVDASFAYQGGGRRLPMPFLEALEKYILNGLEPDLTLLIDVSVEVGLERIKQRGKHDRIEQEKKDFFEDVRSAYLTRSKKYSNRFRLVDANCSLDEMKKTIHYILSDFFKSDI